MSKNVELIRYMVATRPSAATVPPGTLIFVADGAAGSKVQLSDGTAWISIG